jgi:hypothetical protein
MKRTSSTHRWRTWYDLPLASRGKRVSASRTLSPECPRLVGGDGVGDQLHEVGCCIEGGGVARAFDLLCCGGGYGPLPPSGSGGRCCWGCGRVAAHNGDRNIREIGR